MGFLSSIKFSLFNYLMVSLLTNKNSAQDSSGLSYYTGVIKFPDTTFIICHETRCDWLIVNKIKYGLYLH